MKACLGSSSPEASIPSMQASSLVRSLQSTADVSPRRDIAANMARLEGLTVVGSSNLAARHSTFQCLVKLVGDS